MKSCTLSRKRPININLYAIKLRINNDFFTGLALRKGRDIGVLPIPLLVLNSFPEDSIFEFLFECFAFPYGSDPSG